MTREKEIQKKIEASLTELFLNTPKLTRAQGIKMATKQLKEILNEYPFEMPKPIIKVDKTGFHFTAELPGFIR